MIGRRQHVLSAEPDTSIKYVGTRTSSGPCVVVQTAGNQVGLEPRFDLIRHAPVGFDWASRSGSGAAQLALALLAHASGDDGFALEHYQVFKHEIISRLPKFRWELTASQVLQMLHFVSCDAGLTASAGSATDSRSSATIHGLWPRKTYRLVVTAQGSRRNVRKAAKRALLNLLDNQQLRRRRVHHLQIEISIISSREADGDYPDELREPSPAESS